MCPVKNHFGGYKMIKKMVKNSRELALRRASTLPKKNWPAALDLRRFCEACAARVKSAYFSSDFARTPAQNRIPVLLFRNHLLCERCLF